MNIIVAEYWNDMERAAFALLEIGRATPTRLYVSKTSKSIGGPRLNHRLGEVFVERGSAMIENATDEQWAALEAKHAAFRRDRDPLAMELEELDRAFETYLDELFKVE